MLSQKRLVSEALSISTTSRDCYKYCSGNPISRAKFVKNNRAVDEIRLLSYHATRTFSWNHIVSDQLLNWQPRKKHHIFMVFDCAPVVLITALACLPSSGLKIAAKKQTSAMFPGKTAARPQKDLAIVKELTLPS